MVVKDGGSVRVEGGKVRGFLGIAANELSQETVAEKEREWVSQKEIFDW